MCESLVAVVEVGCELVVGRAVGMVGAAFVEAAVVASTAGMVGALIVAAPGTVAVVAAGEIGIAAIGVALDVDAAGPAGMVVVEVDAATVVGAGIELGAVAVVGTQASSVAAGEIVVGLLVVETAVGLTVGISRMAVAVAWVEA